jgi:hypothetical protein
MNMKLKSFRFRGAVAVLSILAWALVFKIMPAEAATVYLLPSSGTFQVGQSVNFELRVDSQGQGFNAAQATIQFPPDILEVKSLDFYGENSVFNFWLAYPAFSNANGTISFIGGTTSGVTGASAPVLKITFTAKSAGSGQLAVSDAAVTAADGSGTNILSSIQAANFVILPSAVVPESPKAPTSTSPAAAVAPPAQIVRKPTLAKKAPLAPEIFMPIYPDSAKWYDTVTDFLVKWNLPGDISGVSTALNQDPKFNPSDKSEGLFDAKTFPALKDGIWYLHVKFKNNVGWGAVTHYRLAIDTVPPLPFAVDILGGTPSDNPAPTLRFAAEDGSSGMSHYLVRINDGEEVMVSSSTLSLSPLPPGIQNIAVKALDAAGNVRESDLRLQILPIESPSLDIIGDNMYAGEGDLAVAGSSLPDIFVNLFLENSRGMILGQTADQADAAGNWQTKFSGPLKKGKYIIEATAKDSRGALSLPAKSAVFEIKERPLLVIGALKITQFWSLSGIIIILALSFAAGWYSRRLWRKQAARKAVIAQRDVGNSFVAIEKNIDKLLDKFADGKIDDQEAAEMEYLLKEIKKNLKKKGKYISDNIREINE